MLWSVPAILYAIGHNMYYSIMSMVDTPVTIQVPLPQTLHPRSLRR